MLRSLGPSPELQKLNRENAEVRRLAIEGRASAVHGRLGRLIGEFDGGLDQTHEVGMRLVSFGREIVFHVTGLGYWNPSLIIFHGKLENGEVVQLVQHVSQLSFLLMALKREDPSKPKSPMGFFTQDEQTGGQPADETTSNEGT